NGLLRSLVVNNGLASMYNVYAALQFLCNSGDVKTPSYSFVGDPSTGMYLSNTGEVSFSSNGNQVMSMNNTFITSLINFLCPRVITSTNGSLRSPALTIGSGSVGWYRNGNHIIL